MKRRVAWAMLKRPVQLGSKQWQRIDHGHEAIFDTEARELVVDGVRIPVENVDCYQLIEEPQHPCPECSELFATTNALGSHRSLIHKIKGKRGAAA